MDLAHLRQSSLLCVRVVLDKLLVPINSGSPALGRPQPGARASATSLPPARLTWSARRAFSPARESCVSASAESPQLCWRRARPPCGLKADGPSRCLLWGHTPHTLLPVGRLGADRAFLKRETSKSEFSIFSLDGSSCFPNSASGNGTCLVSDPSVILPRDPSPGSFPALWILR